MHRALKLLAAGAAAVAGGVVGYTRGYAAALQLSPSEYVALREQLGIEQSDGVGPLGEGQGSGEHTEQDDDSDDAVYPFEPGAGHAPLLSPAAMVENLEQIEELEAELGSPDALASLFEELDGVEAPADLPDEDTPISELEDLDDEEAELLAMLGFGELGGFVPDDDDDPGPWPGRW